MANQRIVLRLLLPVVTAIGIAGMHTLGHPSNEGTASSVHKAAVHVDEEPMAEAVGAAMTTVIYRETHDTGMRMHPLDVCVAILLGGLLVLLVAVVIRDRRRRMLDTHVQAAVAVTVRGPPRPSRFGLVLAHLSVQRI